MLWLLNLVRSYIVLLARISAEHVYNRRGRTSQSTRVFHRMRCGLGAAEAPALALPLATSSLLTPSLPAPPACSSCPQLDLSRLPEYMDILIFIVYCYLSLTALALPLFGIQSPHCPQVEIKIQHARSCLVCHLDLLHHSWLTFSEDTHLPVLRNHEAYASEDKQLPKFKDL